MYIFVRKFLQILFPEFFQNHLRNPTQIPSRIKKKVDHSSRSYLGNIYSDFLDNYSKDSFVQSFRDFSEKNFRPQIPSFIAAKMNLRILPENAQGISFEVPSGISSEISKKKQLQRIIRNSIQKLFQKFVDRLKFLFHKLLRFFLPEISSAQTTLERGWIYTTTTLLPPSFKYSLKKYSEVFLGFPSETFLEFLHKLLEGFLSEIPPKILQ